MFGSGHNVMMSSRTHGLLHDEAKARGVDSDAILHEALQEYIDQPDLFGQSIPLESVGARIHLHCNLPGELAQALNDAAQKHVVKPSGFVAPQSVFTRAVQHYFNQVTARRAQEEHAAQVAQNARNSRYDQLRQRANAGAARFKLQPARNNITPP